MKMDELIAGFSAQLSRAIQIGESAKIGKSRFPVRNIVISGLGGSGIGGTILANILKDDISVPVIVNKEYQIPAFVNENSLVIISSYSGNTEETLSALMQSFKKGAQIVCITSGGLVKEYAETNDIDFISIDAGSPPRAAFGQSFVQLLYILYHLGIIENGFKQYLADAIALIDAEEESIKTEAKAIAARLKDKLPVIYSDAKFEGVSIRFRQQINENSKMLCWHHVVPEMNHNELVGWRAKMDNIAVVFIRNNVDFQRNQERMEFTKEVVKQYASDIVEIYSKGDSDIVRSVYLIHLTDWVSFYIAELTGVDAVEIDVINKLKTNLSNSSY